MNEEDYNSLGRLPLPQNNVSIATNGIPQRIITPLQTSNELKSQKVVIYDEDKERDPESSKSYNPISNVGSEDDCSELFPREIPFPIFRGNKIVQNDVHNPKSSQTAKGEEDKVACISMSSSEGAGSSFSSSFISDHRSQFYSRFQQLLRDVNVHQLDHETMQLIDKVDEFCKEDTSIYDHVLPSLLSILENRLESYHSHHDALGKNSNLPNMGKITMNNASQLFYPHPSEEHYKPHQQLHQEEQQDQEPIQHDSPQKDFSATQMAKLAQEHKYLKTILRDLGYASLIPDYIHRDDDSSMLSTSLGSLPEGYVYHSNQRMPRHVTMMQQPHHVHPAPSTIREITSRSVEDYYSISQSQQYLQEQLYQYQVEIQSLQGHIDTLSSENAQLHSDFHSYGQQRDQDKQYIKSLELELHQETLAKTEAWREMNNTLEEKLKLEREMVKLRQENESLKYELSMRNDKISNIESRLLELEEDLQSRIQIQMEMEHKLNDATNEVLAISTNLTASEVEKQRLKEFLDAASIHAQERERTLNKLQHTCAFHSDQLSDLTKRLSVAEKERDSMKRTIQDDKDSCEKLREELADSLAREATATEKIKMLLQEKASLSTELNLATARNSLKTKNSSSIRNPGTSFPIEMKRPHSSGKVKRQNITAAMSDDHIESSPDEDSLKGDLPSCNGGSTSLLDLLSNDDDSLALL